MRAKTKDTVINEQNEWIVPCNTKYFDVKNAFKELKIIDWRQSFQMKKARVGGLVYLYCKSSSGNGCIAYKGAIPEVNKIEDIIDDSRFSADHSVSSGPCFSLAVFRVFELDVDLSYPKLKEAGLKSRLQGPILVKGELADYLHSCDAKQRKIDKSVNSMAEECLAVFPNNIVEDNQSQGISGAVDSFDELCKDVSNGARTAWLFTPGEKGCMMNRFVDSGIAALDWWGFEFGDLTNFVTREDIVEYIRYRTDSDSSFVNDSLCLYQFSREVKPGDIVICKGGYAQAAYVSYKEVDSVIDFVRYNHV